MDALAMTETAVAPRPLTLTYRGDVSIELLGTVKGPTLDGEYLTVVKTNYIVDKQHPAGATIAEFKYGIRCSLCGQIAASDVPTYPPSQRYELRVRHNGCVGK